MLGLTVAEICELGVVVTVHCVEGITAPKTAVLLVKDVGSGEDVLTSTADPVVPNVTFTRW